MKKIIFLILIIFSINYTYATNSCDKIILQETSFKGNPIFSANIRNYPCTSKSSIIRSTQIGEDLYIIGKVDGWYKLKLKNGNTGWIWDKSVKEINSYKLTNSDKVLIKKINSNIDRLIKNKGDKYKIIIKITVNKALNKYSSDSKTYNLLKEIQKHLKGTEIKESKKPKIIIKPNYNIKLPNFNLNKLKTKWLKWHNEARKNLGLKPYSYDKRLDFTAKEWSELSSDRGVMSHKRDIGDTYYDYWKITSWFKDRGVVCQNINRATNSESIGYGEASCSDNDCTDKIIKVAKQIFDFYMSEKGQNYDLHYRAIKHTLFTKIGFGVAIEKVKDNYYKFYLTTHYCTELVD